jgi:hypothetical protein
MPHRRTHRPLLLAAMVAGLAGLPACRPGLDAPAGGDRAGATTDPARVDGIAGAEAADPRAGYPSPDPGTRVSLPADFPADVHLPPRHRIDSAMDMADLKMVNVTTPLELAQVSADVERVMAAQGWKREMAMQAGDGSTLVYSKDRRQAVYQMLRGERGGTRLAVRTGVGG